MEQASLEALYGLRKHELATVEQAFQQVIQREQEAEQALVSAQQRIVTERSVAMDAHSDDRAVEAFGAWLPLGQKAVQDADAHRQKISVDRDCVRAALLEARAALHVVEHLQEEAQGEQRRKEQRAEQLLLDECAVRPEGLL
ncbi:flagellar FliJ family protein [Neokomagataea anthophila]|nr:flagellar FliJ family protein [Neokomagataea anthophila]